RLASGDRPLIGCPGIRALAQQHLQAVDPPPPLAQPAIAARSSKLAMDMERHVFSRRIDPLEVRIVVQIAVVERVEHAPQLYFGKTDIDQELQMIELLRAEFRFHSEGRAVQLLRGAKLLAAKAVGNHDVIADGQAEHSLCPIRDDMTQPT